MNLKSILQDILALAIGIPVGLAFLFLYWAI